jgi:hypothetical chaperone protein
MSRLHCGVDFGTTNSTVGLCAAGQSPMLIPVEGEQVTIPSALFFSLEDGSVHFGRAAVREYSSLMKETTQVGRDRMTFQNLIGRFLRHLRERLELQVGGVPDQVVFGRPVFFVDGDEKADRAAQDQLEAAARAEGFRHVEFQFEPVAAALHFERGLNSEVLALVVDIGGGTSDFSVLRLSPERALATDRRGDILSTSGVHVGGTDFDRRLSIAEVMPHFGLGTLTSDGKRHLPVWYFNDMATWHRINQLYTAKTLRDIRSLAREAAEPHKLARFEHLLEHRSGHRLAAQVEKAKIELTDAEEAVIALREPGLSLQLPVTRPSFEKASTDLVLRIGGAIDEALRDAQVTAAAIETVILTGGGAQVPLVRAAATSRFPGARVAQSDQFGAVGLGLAVDAARRFG